MRGPRENSAACSALCRFSVTSFATYKQIEPFWCCFPSGWVCVGSMRRWVSPTNSPVSLGVSPAAISTPTGVFSQRFETLFPQTGTLGCVVCFAPQLFLPVCLHTNVRPPSVQSAASRSPPAEALPSPVLLLVWMNDSSLTPWLSDFHTV